MASPYTARQRKSDTAAFNGASCEIDFGFLATGTHDITATSLDAITLGTTVTIAGTVRVNRNFCANYRYPMIVEDARVGMK